VLFELLGYAAGALLYMRARRKHGDLLPDNVRGTVICAAFVGAALGSRLLALLEHPQSLSWRSLLLLDGGRTIVGGILGGWIAVEIVKRSQSVRTRTGDLFVTPLIVGIILGRVGCFLAGTLDDTFGRATSLPWGMDFGDGLARHPLQLYEIAFLLLYLLLSQELSWPLINGDRFRLFVFSYFTLRFGLEFLQDSPRLAGLDALQWAALAGMLWCAQTVLGIVRRRSLRPAPEAS
jgi:prolipoprotein diacylglyceryltransferase